MKFDGTHIVEFQGRYMWCTESGIRFDRDRRPTSGTEVAYLDLICPGHRHETANRIFEPWTEADDVGAITAHPTLRELP